MNTETMADNEPELANPRSYIGDTNFAKFPRYIDDPYPPIPISNEYKIPYANSMESQIRKLRLNLETYRELVLHANSILLWEKQWHPTALLGGVTVFFTLTWLSEPNLLTILALIGLILTISDYVLPSVIFSIFKNETWTDEKQSKYEEICTNIILYKTKLELLVTSYYRMRVTNPKLYFTITILSLILLAWVGGTINNLFLTYVTVLGLVMLPGMTVNGMLNKTSETLSKVFNDLVENAKSKVAAKKVE